MQIIAGVPREGGVKRQGLSKSVIFIICCWLYVRKLLTGYAGYRIYSPSTAIQWSPNTSP